MATAVHAFKPTPQWGLLIHRLHLVLILVITDVHAPESGLQIQRSEVVAPCLFPATASVACCPRSGLIKSRLSALGPVCRCFLGHRVNKAPVFNLTPLARSVW